VTELAAVPVAFKPRLLGVEDVRRACGGIGRDLAFQLMHEVGPVYLGRRLFVRPDDLDAHIAQLRQDASA
jgi:hypothetical protein